MKLFLERLKYSIKKQSNEWLVAIIIAMILIVVGVVFAITVIALPMYLLRFVVGDYSVLWIVVVFIVVLVASYWNTIEKWFHWQFVEPFKKKEEE